MKNIKLLLTVLFLMPFLAIAQVTIIATVTASTCANNGNVRVNVTGVPGPIIYGIAKAPYNEPNIIFGLSPVFTDLEPGDYFYGYFSSGVFVKSATTVTVQNEFNASSSTLSAYGTYYAYCGSADPLGVITATIKGGNGPYTIELLDSANNSVRQQQTLYDATFNGLIAGNYTLRATDNCNTVVLTPNTINLKPNVPYTDFNLGIVDERYIESFFNVIYTTERDVCTPILSATMTKVANVLSLYVSDITTSYGQFDPRYYGEKNPVYKIEIQNASGSFDVYDNLTFEEVQSRIFTLPNDRSKWGLIKGSVTLCGITKTNQLDLAKYKEFKQTPLSRVGMEIRDDPTPADCKAPAQVDFLTNLYQSGGCEPITLDVTEKGTTNTQHYELPYSFSFKLDIGKTYVIVIKDAKGQELPSYVIRNYTSSPSSKPTTRDPNNLYIDPAYFTPLAAKDKINFTDGPSSKNIGKSALTINGIVPSLGLVAPIQINTISGPSVINKTFTPTSYSSTGYSTEYFGLGNDLIPGTYKIRVTDSQCFSEDYEIKLDSYFVGLTLQNVTSEPDPVSCDRYIKRGEIKITAVGKKLGGNPDIMGAVYGYDYVYPRLLKIPTDAKNLYAFSNYSFALKGDATIPFFFQADLAGEYELALSRKSQYRYEMPLPSDLWENIPSVPLEVLPDFPSFDLKQSGGIICPGDTTGDLSVKVNNTTGTVTYFIKKDTDANFPATGQGTSSFTGLTAGNYIVKAKTNCYEIVQLYILKPSDQIGNIIIGDKSHCTGSALNLSLVQLGPLRSVVWTLPNNTTVSGPELTINNLTTANNGVYKVNVVTATGCILSGSITITVNIKDVIVPILDDVTAECSATPVTPTTTDNCRGTITGTTTTLFPITAQGTTIVKWSFDDGNGNVSTANQNVIIKDVTAPVVPTLADVTEECSVSPIAPTTTDNCVGIITGTTTTVFPITKQGTTIVTWSFDDGNGNVSTANQNVIIKDVTAPVVPKLADITEECSVSPIGPTTTDNCVGIITGTTTTVFPITKQGTTIVTWSFDDGNGNISTATQNVIIKDITAPTVPVLANVTAECSATPIAPTTTDNCSGKITGTTTTVFPITTQGTTVVTWSFDDGNGNIATANQNVIIKDVTAPVVPTLADVTEECSVSPIAPTTTDNCVGIITGTTTTVFPITKQGTTIVTWSFDDGNGNISTANQNVIIKDVTAPVVPTLADVTEECSVSPIAPTTTDNCVGIITGTTTTVFPITKQGTTIVTWSFDDGNGNIATANQNVIIKDVTAPVVPILADITEECSATLIAPTTTDNCAGTITGTTTTVFPITTQGTTIVAWNFDDGNGNVSTANQKVIIKDITAPIIPVLADVRDECSVTLLTPTTTDNCGGTIVGTTTTVFPVTRQAATTVVIWTFNDGNGNTSIAGQKVIIDDITAPVIPVLADLMAECSVTPIAPTTTDNCVGTVTGTTTTVFPITKQGTTVVTWSFDDGNGNISTANQNVIIKDVTAPVVLVLADVTAECSATPTAPTTTDNCVGTVTGTTTTVFPITTQGTTIVTWTFDDGNGNVATANQNVILNDITAPVAPTLTDIIAECSATPIAPTTTDNCAGTITGTTTTVFPITTQGTTIVTWSFDDGNGNVAIANQNVIIKDVTAPVVPTLADITAECSATPIAPTTTDNCAGTITGTTTTVFPITTQGTTIVTWSFDDGNGNVATANQNVILNDITAPVVPTLADITAECSATPTAPTTTDNCAGTITGTTTTVFPITTQGTTIVNWSFDDGNGNISTVNQNVILNDVTAPVVPTLVDITGECSAIPIAPTTTDNCVGTITGTTITVFPITTQGTTIVTWSFDDGNGNIATANQNVIIKDVTAPVVPVLDDVTAELSATAIAPTTTDNCAGIIMGTTTTIFPITTQGKTVVTWTFDDGNGNTSKATQNVILKDITAPIFPTLADVTAECSASPKAPTATDNSSGTITGTTTTVFPIIKQGKTVVAWSFDDGNGNVSTANQNVILNDITAPSVPTLKDITAECSVSPVVPTTTDNCAGTITGTTTTVFPITKEGTTVIIWSFDDGNGNIAKANQNVIIEHIALVGKETTSCKTDGSGYIVNLTVRGQAPYTATGSGAPGTWLGSQWTSDLIAAGTNYNISLQDAYACNIIKVADTAPVCCVFEVTCPTFQPVVIGCYAKIPTKTSLNKAEFEALGNADGKIGNQPCGVIEITASNSPAPNCNGTVIRTYSVIEYADTNHNKIHDTGENKILNSLTCTQTFTIDNKVPPTGTAPANLTLQCKDDIPAKNSTAVANVSGSCGQNITVTVSDTNNGGTGCKSDPYILTRTFTLTDCAGLTTNLVQTIRVTDTTSPVFVELLPQNRNVDCLTAIPAAVTLTAFDNCSPATVTFKETKVDGNCSGSYQLIRIWTATDACGNTTTHQQLINVNDTIAPVFVGTMPAAVVKADCDTIPAAAALTATDTCGSARVDFTETREDGDCSSRYKLERVWTATDDCGNQSSFKQTVVVSCLAEIYNGISPNGDGTNDGFMIGGIDCYPKNKVSIFNRYGVILYEKQGYDNVTDVFEGISNGRTTINKGDKLPTGTYFYIIEYDNGGTKVKKSGYIHLVN